jgi:hypothetical protein
MRFYSAKTNSGGWRSQPTLLKLHKRQGHSGKIPAKTNRRADSKRFFVGINNCFGEDTAAWGAVPFLSMHR